jgi:[ribosomal protein S5]-alanine N-acetyltransferase
MLDLNFDPFPIIKTERLILRDIKDADANELFHLRSDKNVMQFIDRPLAETIDDALKLIKIISDGYNNKESITWAITLKDYSELIGTIGFWRIEKEHYRAEIGYLLNPVHQGKGIMQEAIKVVLQYGFETMKLHSVEANVNPSNTASIKLLEKNGFVREGYFRENYFYNGQFLDSAIYSLISK